jgi:cytochrome c oxidase assembly protein subunit 11
VGLIAQLMLGAVAMFGFGFALVPLYDIFCEVTGITSSSNTEAQVMPETLEPDLDRTVTIEFTSSGIYGGNWEFATDQTRMEVHPGELYTAHYTATNLAEQPRIGRATPDVSPTSANRYFKKIECFCFSDQQFAAQETKRMPVLFYVDPALPSNISTVTLAYSFYAREQVSQQ